MLESTRYVVYAPADVIDERNCDQCAMQCQTQPGQCTGEIELFQGTTCAGTAATLNIMNNGTCEPVSGNVANAASYTLEVMAQNPTCQGPNQAPVGGKVVTTKPTTICCM